MTHLQMIMYLHIKFDQYVMISLEVMSRTGLVTVFQQSPHFLPKKAKFYKNISKIVLHDTPSDDYVSPYQILSICDD